MKILAITLVLGFALAVMFASCGGGGDDWPGIGGGGSQGGGGSGGSDQSEGAGSPTFPSDPNNDLATKLKSVIDNAQDGGTYIIEISIDEVTGVVDLPGLTIPNPMFQMPNGITIILRGMGGVRTISANFNSGA